MKPNERRKWIEKKLIEDKRVKIDTLVSELNISSMTVRRDLDQLEKEGKAIRTHGGATLANPLIVETPFTSKKSKRIEQKKYIAKNAVKFVKDHQTILLDSGTTTLEIARLLRGRKNLTVVTNDIYIAAELIDSPLKVILAGGALQRKVGALSGPQANYFFENIYVDILFLGTPAIDVKFGVTSPSLDKSLTKRLMIKSAEKTWLVADSSKIGKKSFSKVCDLDALNGFITDAQITKEAVSELTDYIEIIN